MHVTYTLISCSFALAAMGLENKHTRSRARGFILIIDFNLRLKIETKPNSKMLYGANDENDGNDGGRVRSIEQLLELMY